MFLIIQLSSNLDQLYLVVWICLHKHQTSRISGIFLLRGERKNDLCKNMEWATDLVLQNLARNGITNQTSLQGSLVPLCVPFTCWPLSSLSIKMLALAENFALWMKSRLTVQPLKQYFYIGLLAFQLFAKWNVRSLLEFWFCPSWKQNWVRPIFSLFNNFNLETCWLLICLLTICFFEWKRGRIHINIHQNLQ